MKIKKISETIQLDNFLIKDFEDNNLYTGDIVLVTSDYTSEFAILEYVLFNKEPCILLHSPLLSYNVWMFELNQNNQKNKKYRLFKKEYPLTLLQKDMSKENFLKMKKIYKGVFYRKQWKKIPNYITKNLATTKSNFEHFKDYDKYNLYALIENKNHYEFLFRGDKIEIPF